MPRLEHIGIAVDDVEAVVECFHKLLGVRPYKAETVTEQGVRTHLLDAGTAKLELLEALNEDSPVQRFLDRRGEGMHHVAFEVDDLSATISRLRDAGFDLLSEPPQPGADDKQIAFVHPKETHGVLVEFCESVPPSWSPIQVPRHDGHLSVYERGHRDRPSLLVLHGAAGCTLNDTAPLMRRLESAVHLVGIDLSGHGASAFPAADDLSLDLFAEDVRAVLDALDVSSAHVFGFSLGGGVALRLAHACPDRVDRLAVFQTNVQWTEAQANQMRQRLNVDALAEQAPGRAARLRARHEHPTRLLRRLRTFVERLPDISDALVETLPDISASTLVGSVDRDPLFGSEAPLALHHQLPNARLTILPGEHHNLTHAPLSLLAPLLIRHFLDE
jgi:methylmalonyl-CoA epimerase